MAWGLNKMIKKSSNQPQVNQPRKPTQANSNVIVKVAKSLLIKEAGGYMPIGGGGFMPIGGGGAPREDDFDFIPILGPWLKKRRERAAAEKERKLQQEKDERKKKFIEEQFQQELKKLHQQAVEFEKRREIIIKKLQKSKQFGQLLKVQDPTMIKIIQQTNPELSDFIKV